jgi:uncharacterized protein YfaQ (DUF2300 family)
MITRLGRPPASYHLLQHQVVQRVALSPRLSDLILAVSAIIVLSLLLQFDEREPAVVTLSNAVI